jgi:hypothetical protein
MLMTWFATSEATFAQFSRLGHSRVGKDPFTLEPVTFTGPTYDFEAYAELDRPWFQVRDLEPEAVALFVGAESLQEIERTIATGGSEIGRAHYNEAALPRLYRISAVGLRKLAESKTPLPARAEMLREQLAGESLSAGTEMEWSDALREHAPELPEDADAETELVAAFLALAAAAGSDAVYGLAEADD